MPRFFKRIISAALVFSMAACMPLPSYADRLSTDTLAPRSISELVSEYEGELAFEVEWAKNYAIGLAREIVSRARELQASGPIRLTSDQIRDELELQLRDLARRRAVTEGRATELIAAVGVEISTVDSPKPEPRPAPVDRELPRSSYEKIEWLAPEEATRMLDALPNIGSMEKLEHFYKEAESADLSASEFLSIFRPELAQMADILSRTRRDDELNALIAGGHMVSEGEDAAAPEMADRQIKRLDILRSLSELVVQLLPDAIKADNIARMKVIREIFAANPEISKRLVKYFETRFDPARGVYERGEAAGKIRLEIQSMLRKMRTPDSDSYFILDKSLSILVATVKTDYFIEGRTGLTFAVVPRAIVKDDEAGALIQAPPHTIIWVHVPYGAYGAHSRYVDVARGGLRMTRPADMVKMLGKILHDTVNLSKTQHLKNSDIPEGGSKGAFVYGNGLNNVAAAMAYADGLINFMMADERIAVSSDATIMDPLEFGPDEGTDKLANLITARAWMKGLESWRLLMTGKSDILGGVSHRDNNLLEPIERGNRVTSQGVTQHVFPMVRYLRERGVIKSKEGEPIVFSVTGGLDGDVGSGLIERTIAHYGDKAIIRGVVDGSGVMFDPEGLDHEALLYMYKHNLTASRFPREKLHAGGFVAVARTGPGDLMDTANPNYITLGEQALKHMNTRALDPDYIKELGLEEQYKAMAGLKENEPIITVLNRDAAGRPSEVRVHTAHLRAVMYYLVRADMLLTGGGLSDSISEKNWPLFFGRDGSPTAPAVTHGANIFTQRGASIAMEKRGVVIEPDEKANSVGVEISSGAELGYNTIFNDDKINRARLAAFFEHVLERCLDNARRKFWALRIEAEDEPGESVVTKVSPAISAEIIRLADVVAKSDLVGNSRSEYDGRAVGLLSKYTPDVSRFDKEYPSTLDRVFARTPADRLKAMASKMIAWEAVIALGTKGVSSISRRAGVKEAVVVRIFLEASARLKADESVRAIIDNKEALPPSGQIAKLREVRARLINAIEEDISSTDAAISDVGSLTAKAGTHMLLKPEVAAELPTIAIVMKRSLAESFTGESRMAGVRGQNLREQYRIMKQGLRKTFREGDGIFEVNNREELTARSDELISRGIRVIVLDDGTLTQGLNSSSIAGRAGTDYCVVSCAGLLDGDDAIIPFVNLNAMAMMGVGVIHNDLALFETAYEAFTGKAVTEDMIAKLVNKVLWIIRAMPRCVKITNELPDQRKLKKLFEVSA
jgi:hypothetical protein